MIINIINMFNYNLNKSHTTKEAFGSLFGTELLSGELVM